MNQYLLLHRLDRLTSGLVLFGKSAALAGKFSLSLQNNQIIKRYLARVRGNLEKYVEDLEVEKEEKRVGDMERGDGDMGDTTLQEVGEETSSEASGDCLVALHQAVHTN
eukprot:Platyproteum_vivax@DN12687_c0_g1_i1.p1